MGIGSLIPRVASLTVDCRGENISLTKPIWKLSNDKNVRLRYFVKRNSILLLYCCDHHYDLCFTIPSLPFLNCMGHAVVFNSFINNASERRNCVLYIARLFFLTWMTLNLRKQAQYLKLVYYNALQLSCYLVKLLSALLFLTLYCNFINTLYKIMA
jgi:hypothetical protein